MRETRCWNEYAFFETTEAENTYAMYFQNPRVLEGLTGYGNTTNFAKQPDFPLQCDTHISLPTIYNVSLSYYQVKNTSGPQFTIKHDGDYLLIIHMEPVKANFDFDSTF